MVVVVFEKKHSTVHKADDILQPAVFKSFSLKKTPNIKQMMSVLRRGRSGVRQRQVWTHDPFTASEKEVNHKIQIFHFTKGKSGVDGENTKKLIISHEFLHASEADGGCL